MKDDNVFKAAGTLSGGIGGMNDACGSLLGASLMFGQVTGRSIKDFPNKDKAMPASTLTAQLYKWYEKEFGSPTCREITKRFGGGVSYDTRVPWQADLAKAAGVHDKCVELVGKTAARAAEMLWEALNKKA